MTQDEFWNLLEGLPTASPEDELEKRLAALEPEAIADFQAHFDRAHSRSYNWLLWGAAYIIDGGCSDDGFIDFRYGLISRGKDIFEGALVHPDSLADIASDDNEEDCIANESFGYVAGEVYEKKTSRKMPRVESIQPEEPSGEEWDFDDEDLCARKLPKLWAKFGE